ncbi:hypothetical protein MY1884_001041 [Beauveria asiatica]
MLCTFEIGTGLPELPAASYSGVAAMVSRKELELSSTSLIIMAPGPFHDPFLPGLGLLFGTDRMPGKLVCRVDRFASLMSGSTLAIELWIPGRYGSKPFDAS